MSAVLKGQPQTAEQLLAEARAAYREMRHAKAEMSRLDGYRFKTAGMKADYNRASNAYHRNQTIHDRIMRGLS